MGSLYSAALHVASYNHTAVDQLCENRGMSGGTEKNQQSDRWIMLDGRDMLVL